MSNASAPPSDAEGDHEYLAETPDAAHGADEESTSISEEENLPPPTWGNLPNKRQLAVLVLVRFVDFFHMAALQTVMVHQLTSFDPSLAPEKISQQAGLLQGAFTAAQILTAVFWGWTADRIGRKPVLLIGLLGTGLGCMGVGFSRSATAAIAWRFWSGASNGMMGAARAMIAEIIPERWHSRAFLLLPVAFNAANVAGSISAGAIADPVQRFPTWFGTDGRIGVTSWLEGFPYAMPYVLSALLLFAEAILVHLVSRETLELKSEVSAKSLLEPMRKLCNRVFRSKEAKRDQGRDAEVEEGLLSRKNSMTFELEPMQSLKPGKSHSPPPQRLPWRSLWTSNLIWVLVSISILDYHLTAYETLRVLFFAAARAQPSQTDSVLEKMFKFSSGMAFAPQAIGYAIAITGVCGVVLQLFIYPWADARYGTMRAYWYALWTFPLTYCFVPFLSRLPSTSPAPAASSGPLVWLGIAVFTILQGMAEAFAYPASIILINNNSPHPSVLATVHGIANTCGSLFQTVGPVLASYLFGVSTQHGYIGAAWWFTAAVALVGSIAGLKLRNESGHKVIPPDEETREAGEVSLPRPNAEH